MTSPLLISETPGVRREMQRRTLERCGLMLWAGFEEAVFSPERHKQFVGGWRGSKTTSGCADLEKNVAWDIMEGDCLWWLVGPDYEQTDQEYAALEAWNRKLGLDVTASHSTEGPKTMTIRWPDLGPGTITVQTKSGKYPERLGSVAPKRILGCEAGQFSEDVRAMILGRAMELNATVTWTGTLEDDEGHPMWAWYQEQAQEWYENPNPRQRAFRFPSWENMKIFGNCLDFIQEDPSLEQFCPDGNHPHSGRQHPLIREREVGSASQPPLFDPYTFNRRIAAIPSGVQFQVYPQATAKRSQMLRELTPEEEAAPVLMSAGGLDFGTVHPTVLVVGQKIADITDSRDDDRPKGIIIVREARWLERDSGNPVNLQAAKNEMSRTWHCYRWNVDPNERYLARSFQGDATSYSESGREARVHLSGQRFDYNKWIFDRNGPGVPRLYDQIERIHRRKQADGQLKYVRFDDDGGAAWEDMTEAFDGQTLQSLSRTAQRPPQPKTRARTIRRRL